MSAFTAEPAGHRDAVFGLARRDGLTLLVRNPRVSRGGQPSWWDLPGGALEAGESLPAALRREWREETGLDVAVGQLLFVLDGLKRRPGGAPLYTWRAFFFAVEAQGEPTPGAGIDEAAWVPDVEVAARLEAPYHGPLRDHLAGGRARYASVVWEEEAGREALVEALPRRLLILGAAAAVGDGALLAREAAAARAEGETSERIAETLLQAVPYAGYPRAITAFGVVRAHLEERTDSSPRAVDRAVRGRQVFDAVYGSTAAAVIAGLEALDPVSARWTIEHAYGRVLAREGALSLLERELLAVAILTALGGLDNPLLGHMRACLRLGATEDQVRGAVQVVPAAYGEARRAAARRLLARL